MILEVFSNIGDSIFLWYWGNSGMVPSEMHACLSCDLIHVKMEQLTLEEICGIFCIIFAVFI